MSEGVTDDEVEVDEDADDEDVEDDDEHEPDSDVAESPKFTACSFVNEARIEFELGLQNGFWVVNYPRG